MKQSCQRHWTLGGCDEDQPCILDGLYCPKSYKYHIKAKSITWDGSYLYWFGIPGDGNNWTKSKWEADTFDYLKATRLARTLRDFDLVVSIVKAAYRKP